MAIQQIPTRNKPCQNEESLQKAEALDRIIGDRLRAWRKSCGYRQRDIANLLGITHQQLSKYEQGINRISAGTLCYLAESYNIAVEDLTGSAERRIQSTLIASQTPKGNAASNTGLLKRMTYHFNNIENEEKQSLLCNLAEAMSRK